MAGALPREGSLSETPFARLLSERWNDEANGRLEIRAGGRHRLLHVQNGDVVVDREGLSEADFLAALTKKKILAIDQVRQCVRRAKAERLSIVRGLGEFGLLPPLALWNLMESFFARRIFAFFDLDEGDWSFDPDGVLPVRERLGAIPGQDLVLQGIRQMQNAAVFDRFLPDEDAPIRVGAPARLHRIAWEPHERYALQVLGSVPNLRSFYGACEFGRKDARRTLFAFLCLDVLTAARAGPQVQRTGEAGAADPERALEALVEKCAFVYKYVTREIGPLGRTIIARSIDEIKPALGPQFQALVLLQDGRIEADSAVLHNAGHLPGELSKGLLEGYEEILLAEILAVKKALGVRHESALIKALERIGCA